MYFSKSTKGWYDERVRGLPKISIVDPAWVCPKIEVPDPLWIAPADNPGAVAPTIMIDDPAAVPALIEIDNPNCQMPADAVLVSDAYYDEIIHAPSQGKVITYDVDGMPLAADPKSVLTLDQIKDLQIALLKQGYNAAIVQPVQYTTSGGVTALFDADTNSVSNLANMLAAFGPAAAVPSGFYWVAADNSHVPFTLADMQGLAEAIGNQGWLAFKNLQEKKVAVLAASSTVDVEAVTF